MIGGFFLVVSLYFLGCGIFFYVCLYADPETSPAARYFTETLPQCFMRTVRRLLGPKVASVFSMFAEMFLVFVYLFIIMGGWTVMFFFGYPFISESKHVSSLHKYVGYAVFGACLTSWRFVSRKSPGYITHRTIAKFDNFPYDDLIFVNKICPTVGIRKLPRSKYDRWSRRHVARFDHFCAWLNNPIGEENYRYFLLFLLIHVGMSTYGSYVTFHLFRGEVIDKNLLNAVFYDMNTGEEAEIGMHVIAHFLFARNQCLGGLFILMAAMAIVLFMFLSFHLYITARGMTTNEYYKWKMVHKWYKMEKAKYEKYLKEEGAPKLDLVTLAKTKNKQSTVSSLNVDDDHVDVGCTGPVPTKNKSSLKEEQKTDENNNIDNSNMIMNPGPKPINIYDNGIVQNFKEVIFPRSTRSDAIHRWREFLQDKQQKTTTDSKSNNGEQKKKAM